MVPNNWRVRDIYTVEGLNKYYLFHQKEGKVSKCAFFSHLKRNCYTFIMTKGKIVY